MVGVGGGIPFAIMTLPRCHITHAVGEGGQHSGILLCLGVWGGQLICNVPVS